MVPVYSCFEDKRVQKDLESFLNGLNLEMAISDGFIDLNYMYNLEKNLLLSSARKCEAFYISPVLPKLYYKMIQTSSKFSMKIPVQPESSNNPYVTSFMFSSFSIKDACDINFHLEVDTTVYPGDS
ncbi:hypothetical protein AYI70_g592 [Smittium culicis]|uniref:Uncharacterized protein n=1 Tax=Smittium culicis TaxID=133412 RepID=A0A1R1YG73_9FUNG|nr:hypothetical protein AYI70_g592 [Smittium culicis]